MVENMDEQGCIKVSSLFRILSQLVSVYKDRKCIEIASVKLFNFAIYLNIKTHRCVSVAKKAMWHRTVLFKGTVNSPFSTPCILITTVIISIKFT